MSDDLGRCRTAEGIVSTVLKTVSKLPARPRILVTIRSVTFEGTLSHSPTPSGSAARVNVHTSALNHKSSAREGPWHKSVRLPAHAHNTGSVSLESSGLDPPIDLHAHHHRIQKQNDTKDLNERITRADSLHNSEFRNFTWFLSLTSSFDRCVLGIISSLAVSVQAFTKIRSLPRRRNAERTLVG